MSYQLKKVRLLSYKLHAAFSPSAHFRPKKAPRAIFSRGGGRVYFGVNGRFLCLGGPSYGHWKTMRVGLKNFFDLTPLSPYPIHVSIKSFFLIYYRMCIVCASVECIIWNNFRQKRLRPASEFSQPLSTRVLDTPIIFSYLLIFIFIKKNLSYVIYIHPHPRGLYNVQNKFCARQRMTHSH